MGPFDRRHRPPGQGRRLGRQQLVEHGLVDQRVAEHEVAGLDRHQLHGDGVAQHVTEDGVVDGGDLGEQLPVEPAAEDGGRRQDGSSLGAYGGETGPHRVGDARRRPAFELPADDPAVGSVDEPPGRRQPGQQLLDVQRRALRLRLDEGPEVVGRQVAAEAGGGHRHHALLVDRRQLDDARPSIPEARDHLLAGRRGAVGADVDHAQHRLARERVGQELDDGERVGVGPLEVVEHEQPPRPVVAGAQQAHDRLADEQGRGVRRLLGGPLGHEQTEMATERLELRIGRNATGPEGREQGLGQRTERCGRRAGHGSPDGDAHAGLRRP